MEFRAIRVLDGEYLAPLSADQDFRRTDELSDSVVDMDDIFAGLQFVEVLDARALSERGVCAAHMELLLCEDPVGFRDDEESAAFAFCVLRN